MSKCPHCGRDVFLCASKNAADGGWGLPTKVFGGPEMSTLPLPIMHQNFTFTAKDIGRFVIERNGVVKLAKETELIKLYTIESIKEYLLKGYTIYASKPLPESAKESGLTTDSEGKINWSAITTQKGDEGKVWHPDYSRSEVDSKEEKERGEGSGSGFTASAD